MITMTMKNQILEAAGYRYNFDRELYINRRERKAFSIEFVEDATEESLRAALATPSPQPGEWDFKFTAAPSPIVQRELSAILG